MRRGLIDIQIIWNRLISICEEQAQVMVRAAFSAAVRESGDLSAGLFDMQGRMLAQAVTGTPGHINTMATAVVHFFDRFPPQSMREGDVYVTNDPWLASGHLHDVTIVTPAAHRGRIVGMFAATVHLVDIGGRGMGPDAQDLFEEGIQVPHMYLVRQGVLNEDLMSLMRANSREPLQVEGDLLAIIAAGDEGARRLPATLEEFGETELSEIGDYILEQSRTATEDAIRQVPEGVYRNEMALDGYEKPIHIAVAMHVSNGKIHLDFEGTSARSKYGINVPLAYTAAYSFYGIKCVVAPDVPSNFGSHTPFSLSAPADSLLNPLKPAPVAARHIIGHTLPDAVLGCLAQALPGKVMAESGMMWNPTMRGDVGLEGERRMWEFFLLFGAGMGARPAKDGLGGTAFPAALKNIPAEVLESSVPVVVWRKEFRQDSGGAGHRRGGAGQVIELESLLEQPLKIQAMFDRITSPARGRDKGLDGALGTVRLGSGRVLKGKGQQEIPPGDRLVLHLPGGGGHGDPRLRNRESVRRDIETGLVSEAAAARDYPCYAEATN